MTNNSFSFSFHAIIIGLHMESVRLNIQCPWMRKQLIVLQQATAETRIAAHSVAPVNHAWMTLWPKKSDLEWKESRILGFMSYLMAVICISISLGQARNGWISSLSLSQINASHDWTQLAPRTVTRFVDSLQFYDFLQYLKDGRT